MVLGYSSLDAPLTHHFPSYSLNKSTFEIKKRVLSRGISMISMGNSDPTEIFVQM